jgi:hypothetical protein
VCHGRKVERKEQGTKGRKEGTKEGRKVRRKLEKQEGTEGRMERNVSRKETMKAGSDEMKKGRPRWTSQCTGRKRAH